MSLSSTLNKHISVGNGTTTIFDYEFDVLSEDDLHIYLIDVSTGTETEITSNFTVTPSEGEYPSSSGTVTYPAVGSAITSAYKLAILRTLDVLQPTVYPNNTSLKPKVIEKSFDRITMIAQQQQEEIDRTLQFAISVPDDFSRSLPAPVALKALRINSDATAFEYTTDPEIAANAAAASAAAADSSATDSAASATSSSGYATASENSATASAASAASAYLYSSTILIDDWESGVDYVLNKVCVYSTLLYRCTTAHTSGVSFNASYFEEVDAGKLSIPASSVQGDIIYHNGTSYTRLAAGTSGQVLQTNGASANPSWETPLVGAIAILNETQTSGTAGGTFTSGAWRTRTLNTIVVDQIGITLSSNQFTLPAGTYEIQASAPAGLCDNHKAIIKNITDSTTDIVGTSERSYAGGAGTIQTRSFIIGVFTIETSKAFEIQHYCTTTGGLGVATSISGVNEVFSTITIRKVG